jgi:hypothetical protein
MDKNGWILISCRMTPEEVVKLEHVITIDRHRSRNQYLRALILADVEMALEMAAKKAHAIGGLDVDLAVEKN